MKKIFKLFFVAITVALLSSCVYHQAFEQGNVLTPNKIRSIQLGMRSETVIQKLGSPVLKNVYVDHHMTYVYTQQPTRNQTIVRRLVITFHQDRVTNIRTSL